MSLANQLTRLSRLMLYATATVPFLLWAGFTFPYVTIKTTIFRMAIEVAVMAGLILLARGERRFTDWRRSYPLWLLAGLLLIELFAALLGESWQYSLFGDLERMWGIFTVTHFFLFYVLLRSFFGEQEWRRWWHVSLVASLLVSVYGIIQRNPEFFQLYLFEAGIGRITSTLGNPTYVAIYLLFSIALAIYWLLATEQRSWRYFYGAVIVIDFYAFTLTDIRGAYLGLLLGLALAGLLYLILGKRKSWKLAVGGLFIVGLLALAIAVRYKSSRVVQNIPILRRVVSISLSDETSQTRFIAWQAVWRGFLDDPLTGVGMENYNIVFNKYFQARYYSFAPTETYFDRAHNQYFNILSESGLLALLIYLGLPGLIGYYLIQGYRRRIFGLREVAIFGGVGIAYFVHLFFVFDEVNTLLMFTAYLAFLDYRWHGRVIMGTTLAGQGAARRGWYILAAIILTPVLLLAIVVGNINVLRVARTSAAAYLAAHFKEVIANYRAALAVPGVPRENIILNYADYLIGLGNKAEGMRARPAELRLAISALAEVQAGLKREITKDPNDAFYYLKLGQINNAWYLLDDDKSHLRDALVYIEHALQLSPERLQLFFVLGESLVLSDQSERAIEVLKQPIRLLPKFGASYYYLGRAYLANDQFDEAYDTIVNQGFGERQYDPEDNKIAFALADEAARRGQYDKVVIIYEYLFKLEPKNAKLAAALAAAYVNADKLSEAAATAQRAAELDPEFAFEANYIIQLINEGRIKELKAATR